MPMRFLFPLLSLGLVFFFSAASSAEAEEGRPWEHALIIVDKDPKGTNLRDAPSGKVIQNIAHGGKDAVRFVTPLAANKGWFQVEVDGKSGWMHSSVLGTCSSATEDGEPSLSKAPKDDGVYSSGELPYGSLLTPLDMYKESQQGNDMYWLKVRYTDPKGKSYEGWLMQHTLTAKNQLDECSAAWSKRK